MTNPNKKLWHNDIETLPKSVAVCPECGGEIKVEINETEQGDSGNWIAVDSGMYLYCSDDEQGKGDKPHYLTPYIDWLPLRQPILDYINRTYSF